MTVDILALTLMRTKNGRRDRKWKKKKNFFSAIQYSSESSKNTIEIEKKYYASVSGRFVWNLSDNSFATAFECNSNTLKTKQSLKTEKNELFRSFLLLSLWCIDSNGFRFRGLHVGIYRRSRDRSLANESQRQLHFIDREWAVRRVGCMNQTRKPSSTPLPSRAGLIEAIFPQIPLRMTNRCAKNDRTQICLSCGWFICSHCLHYWAHTRV